MANNRTYNPNWQSLFETIAKTEGAGRKDAPQPKSQLETAFEMVNTISKIRVEVKRGILEQPLESIEARLIEDPFTTSVPSAYFSFLTSLSDEQFKSYFNGRQDLYNALDRRRMVELAILSQNG